VRAQSRIFWGTFTATQVTLTSPLPQLSGRGTDNSRQPLPDRDCRFLAVPPSHSWEGGQGVRSAAHQLGSSVPVRRENRPPARAIFMSNRKRTLEGYCAATYPPGPLSRGDRAKTPENRQIACAFVIYYLLKLSPMGTQRDLFEFSHSLRGKGGTSRKIDSLDRERPCAEAE